jgi:hypothetical protein
MVDDGEEADSEEESTRGGDTERGGSQREHIDERLHAGGKDGDEGSPR